jgi:hypothetical protein
MYQHGIGTIDRILDRYFSCTTSRRNNNGSIPRGNYCISDYEYVMRLPDYHINSLLEQGWKYTYSCPNSIGWLPESIYTSALAHLLGDNPHLRLFFLHSNLLELGFNCILLRAAVLENLIDLVKEHGSGTRRAMHLGDKLREKRIWNSCLWCWLGGNTRAALLAWSGAIRGGRCITRFETVWERGDNEAICSLSLPG